jgi:hypothetical protein
MQILSQLLLGKLKFIGQLPNRRQHLMQVRFVAFVRRPSILSANVGRKILTSFLDKQMIGQCCAKVFNI